MKNPADPQLPAACPASTTTARAGRRCGAQAAARPGSAGDVRELATAGDVRELATASDAARAFCSELSDAIGPHRFGLWFENGTSAQARDGAIVVSAANAYVADWIGRNFRDAMQRAADKALGSGTVVSVEVAASDVERALGAVDAAEHSERAAHRRRALDRGRPAPASGVGDGPTTAHAREDDALARTYAPEPLDTAGRPRAPGAQRPATLRRLEDFVVGESNRLAYAASTQIAEGAPDAPGILFLHGDCGVGKTHLLQGIVRRRTQRSPRQVVRYVTAEQFTNEYIAAVRDGSLEQFRKRLRRVDLLAIDDIHFFANKSATQAEFLHTIDAIDLTGARVALVSDEHPRHIRKFSQSLVSRFLSGMVVRVERPDRETRSQLVRRLARERGLDLTTAAEDLVAGRCAGSIREIEGAITRLGALVELDGVRGQIGPGTVERLLGQDGPASGSSAPIRLGRIVEVVCDRLRVSREDLLGNGRHARTVVARGMVAHLARELTTHSYPEIARALGRDTHSAVHAAAKRLKSLIESDGRIGAGGEPVRELTDQLRHDLARSTAQR
jgi:chromosomal replication initiator protein